MKLHGGHHLLRTMMKFSQMRSTEQQTQKHFINDFNLPDRNAPLNQIRKAYGMRTDHQQKEFLQNQIEKQTKNRKNTLDLNTYMKGMRLANITFDFPKEWTHTRFVILKV